MGIGQGLIVWGGTIVWETIVLGGNCPGGFFEGAIVPGCRRWQLSGGQLTAGLLTTAPTPLDNCLPFNYPPDNSHLGQLSPDNYPPENSYLGTLPPDCAQDNFLLSRTIPLGQLSPGELTPDNYPPDNCPLDNCLLGQLPPYNSHQDNCPLDNFHLEKSPPGQFPRTIPTEY